MICFRMIGGVTFYSHGIVIDTNHHFCYFYAVNFGALETFRDATGAAEAVYYY